MATESSAASSKPPMRSSDEANQEQLKLAREQGRAYQDALRNMTKKEAQGAEQHVGDYKVGYAVEEAEGMYELRDGTLQWSEPKDENLHVEIAVRDASDGRFIPGLAVQATLIGPDGKEVGTHEQPFLWHPWLYHYGRNWRVPGDGEYTLRVHIEAPRFGRHDKKNGKRYEKPVDVEFKGVKVETGQKKS